MLKRVSFYFLFFLLLSACDKEKDVPNVIKADSIVKLQEKASSTYKDSNYFYLKYAERLIKSNTLISDSLKAENHYLLGLYFRKTGNIDSAAVYFHNATDLVYDQIENKRQREYFYKTWNTYLSLDKFGDCFAISEKYKSLLDKYKDPQNLAWYYFFIENTHKRLKEYPEALKNNELRVQYLKSAKDTLGLVTAYISQAKLKYYYLDDKEESFKILDELISKEDQLNLTYDFKRQLYGGYGIFLYFKGDYNKAFLYYKKAIENTKKTTNTLKNKRLVTNYANTVEVLIELKEYKEAKKYLDSVKLLGINNIDRRIQKSILKYQLRIAVNTNNDIHEITQYLDTIYKYQDKTYAEKYNTELVALTKANTKEKVLLNEKQASEITAIKLKNQVFLVSIALIIISLLGILLYWHKKYKFEKQSLQMHQRLLRSQMNPHFTFNTLYAIQNLIKKDPEKSTNYLLKFSRLLRLVLDNSTYNYVQLENELESLTKYMELQLLRFPNKFDYEIVLNEMEEDDLLFIPPMLLQPFVENSIEHGFSNINYLGNIRITLSLQDKYLFCIIEDNGLGITKNNLKNKESKSTNLISDFIEKATHSKIEVINKKELSGNQTGLRIQFLIPYKLSNHD